MTVEYFDEPYFAEVKIVTNVTVMVTANSVDEAKRKILAFEHDKPLRIFQRYSESEVEVGVEKILSVSEPAQ